MPTISAVTLDKLRTFDTPKIKRSPGRGRRLYHQVTPAGFASKINVKPCGYENVEMEK